MQDNIQTVIIDKLVHGGQGLGVLADGRKCFVWGALPGETVKVQLTKKKRDWAEGIVIEVISPNQYRIKPVEPDMYIATSPWQILDFEQEAKQKQAILAETFTRERIDVVWQNFYQDSRDFGYRNKMEYNFWFFNETQKVSLALHMRGTHQKIAVDGSALASDAINNAGRALIAYINKNNIEARPLKSVILRSDSSGNVGITLFVNDKAIAERFADFTYDKAIFEIIYSNPKSPASVATEVLVSDDRQLSDTLLGKTFLYSTRSFFQVNISVYQKVLQQIATEVDGGQPVIDMYSGVGSIGLSVVGDNQTLTMIETSAESTAQATLNISGRQNCNIITADAESVTDYITAEATLIVDPPRAGLHDDVVAAIVEKLSSKVVYLSCNPSTQARDVKQLLDAGYKISYAQGFNFFPRTPHIESLVVLVK